MSELMFPRSLNILGHTVTVRKVKQHLLAVENMGEADASKGEIRIREDLEESVIQATLLHEIAHIIDRHLDLELNEKQISGIAQGFFQVLRNNPRFVR